MAVVAGLTIRDARPDELDEVATVLRDAYRQYERIMPSDRWQSYLEDIMNVRSRLTESELIVASMGSGVVGAVTLYPDGSRLEVWPRDWAGVRLLAVLPEYRGRHIGRSLMEECISRCRQKGIKTLGLHTTEAMAPAPRLYERMGFVRTPEFDFHPSPEIVVAAYKYSVQ